MRRITTQTDVTPVIFGCWGQTEDVRASMDNPLNDYEHLRPQKPQNGRPRNGFIQKRGDHFDRFVTNHRPKTATPGVAGSLTDIMEMHLHVWRVSRVQNAHVWRGTAPPFAIPSHVPPKALHRGNDSSHHDGMAGGERRGALHGWTGTENAPTQRDRVPRQMGRASGDRGWQMHHPHTTA